MDIKEQILDYVRRHTTAPANMNGIIQHFPSNMGNVVKNTVFTMTGQELVKTSANQYLVNHSFITGAAEAFDEAVEKKHKRKEKKYSGKEEKHPRVEAGLTHQECEDRFWNPKYTARRMDGKVSPMKVYRAGTDGKFRDESGKEMEGTVTEEGKDSLRLARFSY